MSDVPEADEESPFDEEVVRELGKRAKEALRKRARGFRRSVPSASLAARSAALVARVEQLPVFAAARAVALFAPMLDRQEVDVRPLDALVRARGGRVYYPSIDPASGVMTFRDPGDPSRLVDAELGFREPDPGAPEATTLDVIIVPALLVDGAGHRLGYGGGFYDRTLPRFCPPTVAVAVVFHFQLAAELPTNATDVKVSFVVTDEAVLTVA